MKKIILLCLIMLSAVLLAGCTVNETSRQKEAGKSQADAVIKCLNNNDSAGLTNLFCKELTSKYSYESSISKAMNLYSGKCLSHKQILVNGNYVSDSDGVKDSHINYTINGVKTDGGFNYTITVYSYLTYKENPDRVGICYIKIVNNDNGSVVEIGKILE